MSRTVQIYSALIIFLLVLVKLLYDLYAAADNGLSPNMAADALTWAWPYYSYAGASVGSGVLPLWNPYSAVGAPFAADMSVGMFHPVNWILFLVDAPIALVIVQFLTELIGMASMYCYTRYLQLAQPARILCVVIFAYALFTEALHPVQGSIFCWLPALLWLTHRFFDAPSITHGLSISVVLALCCLAGFPNFVLYTSMILFVYGTVILLAAWPRLGVSGIISRVIWLAPPLLLVLGLAAVQLLPSYELSTLSVRSIEPGGAYKGQTVFERFSLTMMFRNYFETDLGYVYAVPFIRVPAGVYYLGGTLLLLPFAFVSKRHRTVSIALAASFVFIVLFIVSTRVPALSFMQQIPLADSLRIHGRAMCFAQCLLIILAGIGLSTLCERQQSDVNRSRALLGLVLFAVYAAIVSKCAYDVLGIKFLTTSLAICILPIALVWSQRMERAWLIRCCWFIALVIVVDVSTHRNNRFLVPAFARADKGFVSSNIDRAKAIPDHYRVLFVPDSEATAYEIANTGSRYQVPNINAYSPMVLARWENLIRHLAGEQKYDRIMANSVNARFYGTFFPPLLRAVRQQEPGVLELASVRYLISQKGIREIEQALPRAYAVRHYTQTTNEAESLAAVKSNLGVIRNTVVLENASPSFASAPMPVDGQGGEVVIREYSSQQIELDAELREASIVVLTDAFYPGWEAYVDGEKVPVVRANSLFRAVEVPAGKHRISFQFHSDSLFWGMTITLASLALVIVLAAWDRTWRRRTSAYRGS